MTPEFIYKSIFDMGMKLGVRIDKAEDYANDTARLYREGRYFGKATDLILATQKAMEKESGNKMPRKKRRRRIKEAPIL